MLASIDVGSNTVRLLLGAIDSGRIIPHLYVRRITRLKGGQTDQGLAQDAMERTLSALKTFSTIIAQHQPVSVRTVGTEALRSAANSREFISQVLEGTGLDLEVIDGSEEAALSAAGTLSGIKMPSEVVLVFDIGGGSTEFILSYNGELIFWKSCQLGVVDLAETLPLRDNRFKKIQATITTLIAEITPKIQQLGISMEDLTLIGTAGTATTIAAMDMQMIEYDWRRVNGYSLEIGTIESMYSRLAALTTTERELLPGMEKGRGDLIPAGIEITLEIMRQFHSNRLTISDFGLLEGILLKMPLFSDSNR